MAFNTINISGKDQTKFFKGLKMTTSKVTELKRGLIKSDDKSLRFKANQLGKTMPTRSFKEVIKALDEESPNIKNPERQVNAFILGKKKAEQEEAAKIQDAKKQKFIEIRKKIRMSEFGHEAGVHRPGDKIVSNSIMVDEKNIASSALGRHDNINKESNTGSTENAQKPQLPPSLPPDLAID
jgi:hypothetical protein